jgi:malonyl CoA-acyl carrier protein transacylase
VPRFAKAIEAATFSLPAFEVISNVDVAPYTSVEQMKRCLLASLVARVRWHETAETLARRKPDFVVECGASAVLAPMMRRLPGVDAERCLHVADMSGIAKLKSIMLDVKSTASRA